MLHVETDTQKAHVISILGLCECCCHFPINNDDEGCEERGDALYVDGDITFDKMAEIVDYIRSLDKKDDLFEKCWVAYRRKGSKKKAIDYWNKLSDSEKESVMPHIAAYVSSREISYQRDFERYLRDKLFQTIVTSGNNVVYDPSNKESMNKSRDDIILNRFYDVLGDEEGRIYGIDEYQWHMMTDKQKDWHRKQPEKRNKLLTWIKERNG